MIEFFGMITIALIWVAVMNWRKDVVISKCSDSELLDEIKRRNYMKKLKDESDSEVENLIK